MNLENNLFELHGLLRTKTYRHSSYVAFNIYDPKFRHIHKAIVRDRIVHHAIVSVIEPIFDESFAFDSYSCRSDKGIHRAVNRLFVFSRRVSLNYKDSCFALKLDISKFFASIDHEILLDLLKKKLADEDLIWLLQNIIHSFSEGKGIPIGNLTSQIFANIYLNELDKFVKQNLRVKYYIRYADDFVAVTGEQQHVGLLIRQIEKFLQVNLKLSLHRDKIIIRKLRRGIDFLGYIVLPYYILPRTKTKKRIFRKLEHAICSNDSYHFNQSLQSYLGYLKHANSYKIAQQIQDRFMD